MRWILDDLLCNAVQLFLKCPDVLEYYQNRFRYIMVDEYQDTNHVQYLLSNYWSKSMRIFVWSEMTTKVFISSGAPRLENIMSFEKSFPGAKLVRLEQITARLKIFAAANAVIE